MLASGQNMLLGAALLLAALPAFAAEENSNVAPVAAAPTAIVKCPGITNIPFTADAEQTLPLRIVGSLRCGETVAVLSDQEGYTARIRTSSGQEGYVAQMYLASEGSAPMVMAKSPVSSATPENGIVRWAAGAPGCDEFLSHGRHVESITANGITVQVSLQDSGWKYRANVAVSNQSTDSVVVVPGNITLDELTPNMRVLLATEAVRVAHSPTHQVFWTLANAVPSPSAVAEPGSREPESQRLANRTSPMDDYLNPHLALTAARQGGFERTESIDVASVALKTASVPTGKVDAGVMWFERDVNAHELSLRVPVADMVFDFSFSLEQKKQ
jgi:hypothetical protein